MDKCPEALMQAVLDALNAHDVERAVAFYAPDYEGVDVNEPAVLHGPDGIREAIARCFSAFPDLHAEVRRTIVQGNSIVLVWIAMGTHRGRFMNIPPSGRAVQVQGISVCTVEGGKIAQEVRVWDLAGLLRSIGLLPQL